MPLQFIELALLEPNLQGYPVFGGRWADSVPLARYNMRVFDGIRSARAYGGAQRSIYTKK